MARCISISASAAVLALAASLQAQVPAGPALSPYLFGQNLWHAVNPGDGANQVWGRMKAARFALIRVGGIEFNERMPGHATWSAWADSIRRIGAEPLFQVSTHESPEAAAALVTAMNVTQKRAIRFWAIGNEPTCGQAAPTAARVAEIAASLKARASAMKKADPSIKIILGDECFWRAELYNGLVGGADAEDVSGKDAAGNFYADYVSFHSYPFPGADKNAVYTRAQVVNGGAAGLRSMMQACTTRVARANAKQGRAGAQALGCALTEFNVTYWNPGDNSIRGVGVRSFLNGQFTAEILASAMEYGFLTAAPWCMFESAGSGAGADLGMFDGAGPYAPRPYYHHLALLSAHMSGRFLPSTDNQPLVKTYGTVASDRAAIVLLNQHRDTGSAFTLKFAAGAAQRTSPLVVTLPAGYPGEIIDTIGPEETLVLVVHASGKVIARSAYSVRQAEQGLPPQTVTYPIPTRAVPGARALPEIRMRGGEAGGSLAGEQPWRATLRGRDGRRVREVSGNGRNWRISARGLPAGLYLLTLRHAQDVQHLPVVVSGDQFR